MMCMCDMTDWVSEWMSAGIAGWIIIAITITICTAVTKATSILENVQNSERKSASEAAVARLSDSKRYSGKAFQ